MSKFIDQGMLSQHGWILANSFGVFMNQDAGQDLAIMINKLGQLRIYHMAYMQDAIFLMLEETSNSHPSRSGSQSQSTI